MKIKVLAGVSLLLAVTLANGFAQSKDAPKGPDQGMQRGKLMIMMQGPVVEGGNPMMMDGYPIIIAYLNLGNIYESYGIKAQRAFLDAREKKLGLNEKREALLKTIFDNAEKYKTNKNAGGEVTKAFKELKVIQDQVQAINKEAMETLKAINEERDNKVKEAVEAFLKKLESDKTELDKFINFINNRQKGPK